MGTLGNPAKLREMLFQMEQDLGLGELSQNEKDILYAFRLVLGQAPLDTVIRADEVRKHPTVAGIKHATYHRALKSLLARGFIEHAPDRKTGAYKLVDA